MGALVVAAALTAALGLIAIVPTASASIADYQAEGVPVPSWFTDTTTKLGCSLGDDPRDEGLNKRLTCGQDWSVASCYANMSDLSPGSLVSYGPSSPGGYSYAEFDCVAAPPNVSPPDQCYERDSLFGYTNAGWALGSDTGWIEMPGYIHCVYSPSSRAAAIKKCKKKKSPKARKKCIKKANGLARTGAVG